MPDKPTRATPPPYTELKKMRDDSAELRDQLINRYRVTKNPLYKRLWQHAATLETHLARMHDADEYDRVGAKLKVIRQTEVIVPRKNAAAR